MVYRHLSLLPEEVDELVVGVAALGEQVLGVMRERQGDHLQDDYALHPPQSHLQSPELGTPQQLHPLSPFQIIDHQ